MEEELKHLRSLKDQLTANRGAPIADDIKYLEEHLQDVLSKVTF